MGIKMEEVQALMKKIAMRRWIVARTGQVRIVYSCAYKTSAKQPEEKKSEEKEKFLTKFYD